MSLQNRLSNLEKLAGTGCAECREQGDVQRFYLGEGDDDPEPTRCPRCGRMPAQVLTRRYIGVDLASV